MDAGVSAFFFGGSFNVSQARQRVAVGRLRTIHAVHSQVPLAGLNLSIKLSPEGLASTAGLVTVAAGLVAVLLSFLPRISITLPVANCAGGCRLNVLLV